LAEITYYKDRKEIPIRVEVEYRGGWETSKITYRIIGRPIDFGYISDDIAMGIIRSKKENP